MLFLRSSRLKLTYVLASPSAEDETREVYLELPGIGRPSGVYPALKGGTAGMDWPKGSAYIFLDFVWGNTLIDGNFGVKSWSVTAEPGLVPGKLEVASYNSDNSDDSDPDFLDAYDLDAGAWDTGELRLKTGDGSAVFRQPRLRWTPFNLTSLLP
jgi:hypothetical protein